MIAFWTNFSPPPLSPYLCSIKACFYLSTRDVCGAPGIKRSMTQELSLSFIRNSLHACHIPDMLLRGWWGYNGNKMFFLSSRSFQPYHQWVWDPLVDIFNTTSELAWIYIDYFQIHWFHWIKPAEIYPTFHFTRHLPSATNSVCPPF